MTLVELFTSIANAIRSKKGTEDKIRAINFASEIEAIQTGGEENAVIDTTLKLNNPIYMSIRKVSGILDLTGWTSLKKFCYDCKSLQEPIEMDTSNITNMESMYGYSPSLQRGGNYNTSNVTTMYGLYCFCTALADVPEYDAGNVSNIYHMFKSCSLLTDFGGLLNLGKAYTKTTENYSNYTLELNDCSNLTLESAINILNKLYDLNLTYDVANGGTLYRQKIRFNSTVLANLQASEEGLQALANADAKGWNVTT